MGIETNSASSNDDYAENLALNLSNSLRDTNPHKSLGLGTIKSISMHFFINDRETQMPGFVC